MKQPSFRARACAVAWGLLIAGGISANTDGMLDTTLNPSLGAFPFYGVPGLVDYAIDYGGTAPTTNDDYASVVLALPDGRIVVAGRVWSSGSPVSSHVGVVERFMPDGSTDTTFGTAGRVEIGAPGSVDLYISSIAQQGDKLLVAAAYRLTSAPATAYALLTRLDNDGNFDADLMGGSTDPFPSEGFNKVITDSAGNIYLTGYFDHPQGRRLDVIFAGPNAGAGNVYSFNFVIGSGTGDGVIGNDLVLRHMPGQSCGDGCVIPAHDELLVVGTAYMGAYGDGLPNHDCVVAAFRRNPLVDMDFHVDAAFNGGQPLVVDFPAGGTTEGDNICLAAAPRIGSGVVIAGANQFISTLGGGSPGLASTYALAEVDESGAVTRQDAFAFFQEPAMPGIFNAIFALAREPGGKLVVAGSAGSSNALRAPSDAGVIRFNADYSRDATFGNDGAGLAILSLDGQGSMATGQREWATSLARDNHGRILLAGTRSYDIASSGDYDWLIARLDNADDVIFRDGFDNAIP